ncbi:hypothetical protein K490DRAFT_72230 [Saccharata proteae CBS 121410]|uniref:Effector 5 n=1 Tax=Saccharata proteae CBS 121410 TaxID=1314787 RepID=A0A6A5YDA7_9PEZI|nr:hypothetical protein K490DRAFT_72230 [Saccharata proteae CBS 121410]
MRFSTFALAATAITGAAAGHLRHGHRHMMHKKAAEPALIDEAAEILLKTLGLVSVGINAVAGGSNNVWIGTDGDFTNEFTNSADEDVVLVIWGSQGSWVNTVQPLVTLQLAANESKTVSFANGASGAWSAIYSGTGLVNGQISETWGEYTFSDSWSTVDVSREVNMDGHGMTIETPKCVTNMTTCVFQCKSGTSCWQEYELLNCDTGSQEGASYGEYDGAPSGGCMGMSTGDALKTTLH